MEESYKTHSFVLGISNRKELYRVLYDSVSEAFYGFFPFILRHMARASAASYGPLTEWVVALSSSALIGAYKYWSKGGSPYIGAYDNFVYALATISGADETLSGSAWTTALIEGTEAALKSFQLNDFGDVFTKGAVGGAVIGFVSWILLEHLNLYGQCQNNVAPAVLTHALFPWMAKSLGIAVTGYNLYKITQSQDIFTPKGVTLGILNLLCASALITSAASTMTLAAVFASMELAKIFGMVLGCEQSKPEQPHVALATPPLLSKCWNFIPNTLMVSCNWCFASIVFPVSTPLVVITTAAMSYTMYNYVNKIAKEQEEISKDLGQVLG